MANHGYISRDGVPSVVELTTASNQGMYVRSLKVQVLTRHSVRHGP
jgi:hypothetical protein